MNSADHFETIVNEHSESLFRFAMSLTRSECDAKDLTQHTFYMWATRGHQLRDIAKVKTWLFTTLHRAFLAGQRKHIRFPLEQLDRVSEELPVFTPIPGRGLDCSRVLTALESVDERFQAAVALFYLEDYSYQEIAVILEVPVGTVKSRISRGIAQLRGIIEPKGSRDLPLVGHLQSTASDSV
jgi:RNA polymerase sigma-70 factor (ECF subfamily)